MNALLTYIVIAALIDSVNLNAVTLQIYLLTTAKPVKLSLSFIAGNFLANLTAGLLLTFGLTQIIFQIYSSFIEIVYLIQFLLGFALVLIGVYFYEIFGKSKTIKKLQSPKPIYVFFLGVTIAFSDVFSALPYFAAIEKIAQAKLSFFQSIVFLFIYNFVFIFPLIILLFIYLFFQKNSTSLLDIVQQFVNRWFPKIMRLVAVFFGLVLIFNSCVNMSSRFSITN